jgi:tRNA(fMet)-specific endonuclease VapC
MARVSTPARRCEYFLIVILDTDHLSILERGGGTAIPLQLRLEQVSINEVCTTIINYEEQMRVWLAHTARAEAPIRMHAAYALLEKHIETFRDLDVLSFDAQAVSKFEILLEARVRVGTMDLKIAAICLAQRATLLTRNLKDFRQVPALQAEDWSV